MLACRGDTICWSDIGGDFGRVRCRTGSSETSYMLRDVPIALAVGEDVCWLSQHGLVSCTGGTLQGSATQIGLGLTYGAQVFTSLTTYYIQSSTVAFTGTLATGPYTTCNANSLTGYTCYAYDSTLVDNSFTKHFFEFNGGTLAMGAGAFLAISDGTLTADGLHVCGVSPCTSFTDDAGILPLPSMQTTSVARAVIGNGAACVLYDDSTTFCWGESTVPTLSGVSDICIYNGGMCGLVGNTIECTGPTAFVDSYFAMPAVCNTAEIHWNGICIACAPGSDIQQGVCTACTPGHYRSVDMTSCALCGTGSMTNGMTCTACGPAYDSTCVACGPGSQSYDTTCTSCTAGTYRDTQSSCSICPGGTLPTADAITCARCALPYALLYAPGATTYAQGTCTVAPDGYSVYGMSWTQCDAGTTRTGLQPSCVTCPPGTIHNASHTFCVPCPDGQVRNTGGSCFACPSGLLPNSNMSGCAKHSHFSSTPLRYAGFAIGGFGLLTAALFYGHATPILRVSVLAASILILVFCALIK